MTQHRIRLRGGWECRPVAPNESDACRLTLPTRWVPDRRQRLRLTRRFHRPPLEVGDHIVLHLEQVPGIQSLEVNGQPATRVSPELSEYQIILDPSADHYRLVLEVETPGATDSPQTAMDWGVIGLVIRSGGRGTYDESFG